MSTFKVDHYPHRLKWSRVKDSWNYTLLNHILSIVKYKKIKILESQELVVSTFRHMSIGVEHYEVSLLSQNYLFAGHRIWCG